MDIGSLLPSPGDILGEVLGQVWAVLWSSPLLLGLVALLLVAWLVRASRAIAYGLHRSDPVRRFSSADRAVILARAGHRCEHHHPLYGRCEQTEGLQADHVHPHSRGGWTAVENGAALCRRHNKAKSARAPWDWELKRLARRRADYFPLGTPAEVTRHRPRPAGVAGHRISRPSTTQRGADLEV